MSDKLVLKKSNKFDLNNSAIIKPIVNDNKVISLSLDVFLTPIEPFLIFLKGFNKLIIFRYLKGNCTPKNTNVEKKLIEKITTEIIIVKKYIHSNPLTEILLTETQLK
jgi:hypothetical protein